MISNESIKAQAQAVRQQYLLDQYAGQALRGLLAAGGRYTQYIQGDVIPQEQVIPYVVNRAWDIAETMLAERSKRCPDAEELR